MSESLENLRERFRRWRSALEDKGLKVNVGKTKMMVSVTEGKIVLSKIDPCGICGKRVGSNAMCCTQCTKRIHGRCLKMKKVTCSSARHFVCRRCTDVGDGTKEPVEVLCDKVDTVKGFCYLRDMLNASGGCVSAVTSRVRIGWMKFRECGELLNGRRFSLRMKEMVYRSCVRSAMLYGSETWCLRDSEMSILRRTERAVVRSMCGVKLVNRKKMEELMEMLGLKKTLDRMAKANGVRWYGHVIGRDDDNILKKARVMEVNEKRKRRRPKTTWRRQMEEEAVDRTRWREGVKAIAEGMKCIRPPSATRRKWIETG